MTNPERMDGPTLSGGAYSELYKLDRSGNLAKSENDVVERFSLGLRRFAKGGHRTIKKLSQVHDGLTHNKSNTRAW